MERSIEEVLFKAQNLTDGDWVEGYYLQMYDKDVKKLRHFIYRNACMEAPNGFVEIDPETLCQYMNIVDADNNKIFTDDIVEYIDYDYVKGAGLVEKKIIGKITWETDYVGCSLKTEGMDPNTVVIEDIAGSCKIIGNIHN